MRRLVSSTPLRLSVAIAVLFAVVSIGSLAATFLVARDAAETTLRETVDQEMRGLRATPTRAALVALVRAQAGATGPERRILSYRVPGLGVVGNAALFADDEGFRVVSIRDRGEITGSYVALSQVVHGGLLTVAVNADRVEAVRESFLRALLFSLVPTVLIVLGGGYLLARRSGRRLARIERALDALTRGELAARVAPTAGREDDLSRIGLRIDRMAAAQERQVETLRQVSTDIAHDLKTPIQRVAVLLEQLRAQPDAGEAARALADRARAEAEGIVRTFEALLQIAQIEGGSPAGGFGPVDLADLAATLAELYGPAAEQSGHRLVAEPGPAWALGDRTLLGQVLANLIENALRHTPGGGQVVIRTGTAADGREVWMELRDSGPGIPPAERDKVIRRLYRLEASRTTPGSGLGLSLVAAIAELHGGRLELGDATPGRAEPGLQIRLWLARAAPGAAESPALSRP